MIQQRPDGTYVWEHRVNMYTNPTLFITVCKAIALTLVITWLLIGTIILCADGFKGFWGVTQTMGLIVLIFAVFTLFGYLIVALMYGGRYAVQFEMSEKAIVHRQIEAQHNRFRKMGLIISFLGLVTGKPGRVGQGMMVASHNTSTSVLKNVTKLKGHRGRGVIYVTQGLSHNQVYVTPEDYDFVFNFLKAHCPKAKVK